MSFLTAFFSKKNIFYILKYLSITVIFGTAIEMLRFTLNINEPTSSKVEESFLSNMFWASIGIVLVAPILEEIAFRLPLKKNSYYLISITFCFLFFLSASSVFLKVTCFLYIIAVLAYQFSKISMSIMKNVIIILSTITFVLLHVDNYQEEQLDSLDIFSKIFLFLPQLVAGFILVKVRLKTFFFNAVIIHSLYNLIILTFALLFNY